ncbi:pseudaminic acid cytidylyltransferase [Pelagibacterales bacterium SAG-MED09]|nr:pseudaminic acid cytidylyltransferase [Pelagibacterales bacterium SAG-MED09]
MKKIKKVLAILPARGGSKRIKKKNIKIFNGKPMIYWSLKILIKSKLFDKIIVSTEDQKIKKLSLKFGANVIIERPKKLSGDFVGTQEIINHSIKHLENQNFKFDYVCCVYPCSPFLQISDLKKAAKIAYTNDKFVFPVLEYSHPIQRAMYQRKNKDLHFINKRNEKKRTQDLRKTFHDAGQFYFAKKKIWMSSKKMHSYAKGIVIPNWRAIDIDNTNDWIRAQKISKYLTNSKKY